MTYVELKRKYTPTGKRKPVEVIKQYDISENLWAELQKYSIDSDYCFVGIYEYNKGTLYIDRTSELDDLFKSLCTAPADYELFDEIRKTISFEIKEMDFKYEYETEVIEVDLENRLVTLEKRMNRKELDKWISEHNTTPPVRTYKIGVSDQCLQQNIKPKDIILVRKFINNVFLAVRVVKTYEETKTENNEIDIEDYNDILGDY